MQEPVIIHDFRFERVHFFAQLYSIIRRDGEGQGSATENGWSVFATISTNHHHPSNTSWSDICVLSEIELRQQFSLGTENFFL